jgi:hypothetical protein
VKVLSILTTAILILPEIVVPKVHPGRTSEKSPIYRAHSMALISSIFVKRDPIEGPKKLAHTIGFLILLIGVLILPLRSISYAESADNASRKIIGGWGMPSQRYGKEYCVNYARGVFKLDNNKMLELAEQKGYFLVLNLVEHRGTGNDLSVKEYLESAENFSGYRKRNENVIGVSQDDFRSWWKNWARGRSDTIAAVRDKIKTPTSALLYGGTFYEDDFEKMSQDEISVISRNIDLVHFYLHKRYNLTNYDKYFQVLKANFPSSRIILGIYNYDRRAYEKRGVTRQEELFLFRQQIELCFEYLRIPSVTGVEFYYGLGENERVAARYKISGGELSTFHEMRGITEEALVKFCKGE